MQDPRTPIGLDSGDDGGVLPAKKGAVSGACNRDAFEAIVRSHGARLLATARRLLLNDEDARDAVQDAFLSAVRSLDRFDGDAQLSTWLHRVVINAAWMKLRTRRRSRERPSEELLPSFLPDGHHSEHILAWEEPCDTAMQRRESHNIIIACLQRLPEDYRVVLVLRGIEGLDTKEAAGLLEISDDAVKTRLHRARQAHRTLLNPHVRGGAL